MIKILIPIIFVFMSLSANARVLRGDWESAGVPMPIPLTKIFSCRAEMTNHQYVDGKGLLVAYVDFTLDSNNDWTLKTITSPLPWKWLWLQDGDEKLLNHAPAEAFDTQSITVSLANDTEGPTMGLSLIYRLGKYRVPIAKTFQSTAGLPLTGKVSFLAVEDPPTGGISTSRSTEELELYLECK